ncbi:unnamed protein product, partial [Rotaria magnacalcarata]
MKLITIQAGILLCLHATLHISSAINTTKAVKQPKLLVFTKIGPYYHESIPFGIAAIEKLGRDNEFLVDATNDSSLFTNNNLKQYSAVVFLSTTGDVLNDQEKNAFVRFIRSDKGFVGIHSAIDTEYGWPWYNKLLGGYFMSHPIQQNATLNVIDRRFIATKHLPKQWKRFDEWYSFQATHWTDVHILITIDEKSYIGGEHGQFHPMSWYHRYDGGRAFYTQLSHREES